MKTLIVGLQYGDEGKGRVSAYFAKDHDWCIRFNGGPNAGHTVWHEGRRYALHHLPAGAVMGKKIALDSGMVVNLQGLIEECKEVGLKLSDVHISENVHLIQKEHLRSDSNGSGIGSTKRGIAYVYADRALRKGTRTKDYVGHMLRTYRGLPPVRSGESALYESAQGIMLDVDYGHYPYVTSSSVFPSTIHNIDRRIGVLKAYTSRVGDGPPNLAEVDWLCPAGAEYGTTTGRARRCTWLIVDEVEYALSLFKPDAVVVTKLDILKQEKEICVWEHNELRKIGNISAYKEFLLKRFPQIKYFSESADGDLIEVI
jgi:adenylosuccinate synthase